MDNSEEEIGYVISVPARNYYSNYSCYLNHYLKNVLNDEGKEIFALNPSVL